MTEATSKINDAFPGVVLRSGGRDRLAASGSQLRFFACPTTLRLELHQGRRRRIPVKIALILG